MPENKSVGQVFWENVTRYQKEKKIKTKKFCEAIGASVNWFHLSKRDMSLPQQDRIRKITILLDLQYVDLFEDWDD